MSSEFLATTSQFLVGLKNLWMDKMLWKHLYQIHENWAGRIFITSSCGNSLLNDNTHAGMQRWIWNLQLLTDLTFEYNKFVKKLILVGMLDQAWPQHSVITMVCLDRCNIQGSIICTNAYIKDNASLKDCQVGDSHTITEAGEWVIEAI